MKKVVNIISDIDKAIAFEWISSKIDKSNIQLFFILLNASDSYLENYLKANNIPVYRIRLKSKKDYPLAFIQLIKILVKIKPTVVHTHLRDANFLGLFAGKLLGIKKRIYTRHSSTYNQVYYPHAVKYDKLTNWLATDIVAISENVKNVLINEGVKEKKITLIHHGFDLDAFTTVDQNKVNTLKAKYIKNNNSPVIGVISRYIKLKGYQYIIPAFKEVLKVHPNALLIIANANGPDKKEIKELLYQLIPKQNFVEIKFEKDLFTLYQLFDVYVHTPIDEKLEAFGQTYVEALAAGVPSVFTLSGIAPEFVIEKQNALVVPFKDAKAIEKAVLLLLEDKTFQLKLSEKGKKDVRELFNLELFILKLTNLYLNS